MQESRRNQEKPVTENFSPEVGKFRVDGPADSGYFDLPDGHAKEHDGEESVYTFGSILGKNKNGNEEIEDGSGERKNDMYIHV